MAGQPDDPDAVPAQVDVLVAGSGAAGLTAALVCATAGLRTLVCEGSALLGGTSAVSGGRLWVPGNHFQADPQADRRAAARYLDGVFDPRHTPMVDAFLEAGPRMLRFVEGHTAHRFVPCPLYPDYLGSRPGATEGGRCLDMRPLSLDGLDPLVGRVRLPHGYVPLTHAEWEHWRLPQHYDRELLDRRDVERVVTGGVALVSALLDGVLRASGLVRTGLRLVDVGPRDDEGRTAVLETGRGTRITVEARHVVLATGGYDQDPQLRAQHLPKALSASASSPANRGDALRICRQLGAGIENLGEGWWMPMVALPGETVDGAQAFRSLIRERGLPRQIVVNRAGRRFVDEAAPYHEFGKAMHRATEGEAYLVVDAGHRRRYPLPGIAAGEPAPEWVRSAPTVAELAVLLGVDPAGLCDEVRRWNEACALGRDEGFGRGDTPYDRYHGDPEQPGNPNLGPLDEPPFFGVRVLAGTIGSKGGPVTDPDGQVVTEPGTPIPGLFAVGNAAAFWTGDGYPGPGATLGTGMTLAFRAGQAIVRANTPAAVA